MLLEFGARNFYSFEEGFEVSLRPGESNLPKGARQRGAATLMCVKGANASGKTNVLRALKFITDFCRDSFASKPRNGIGVIPHFSSKSPSDFYAAFSVGRNECSEYRYELSVTPDKVNQEAVYLDGVLVVKRKGRKFTSLEKPFDSLSIIKLRDNASFISTAHQYEVKAVEDIYHFFDRFDFYIDRSGRREPLDYQEISETYYENKDYFDFMKGIISRCDLGTHDVEIFRHNGRDGPAYQVVFSHRTEKGVEKVLYELQSSGTQALYELLCLYRSTLKHGHIRVVDEIEVNLHPHILPVLTGLFDSSETNPKNAQLIFTTHDSSITDILGKHRTIMVEKEDNASLLYRLDEIPGDMPGYGKSISALYRAGEIGGLPKIA